MWKGRLRDGVWGLWLRRRGEREREGMDGRHGRIGRGRIGAECETNRLGWEH